PGSSAAYIPTERVSRLATVAPHAGPAPGPAALSLAQAATNAPTRSAAIPRLVPIPYHTTCRRAAMLTRISHRSPDPDDVEPRSDGSRQGGGPPVVEEQGERRRSRSLQRPTVHPRARAQRPAEAHRTPRTDGRHERVRAGEGVGVLLV